MKLELNIEQKLAYVRKALEMGADIEVQFHDFRSKEEAEKAAEELSDFLKIPYNENSNENIHWFKIRNNYSFQTTIFFDEEKQKEAM